MQKQLKFGLGQVSNPTPKFLKYIFRFVLFLTVAWATFSPQFKEIPEILVDAISRWSVITVGLIRLAISFFGLDYDFDEPGVK